MADGPDAASGHERSLSCARKPELSTRGATTTDLLNGYTDLYPSTVGTHAERRNATITRARPVAGVLRLRLYPIGAA